MEWCRFVTYLSNDPRIFTKLVKASYARYCQGRIRVFKLLDLRRPKQISGPTFWKVFFLLSTVQNLVP